MVAERTDTESRWRMACRAALIVVPALGLIAVTWAGTLSAIHAQARQAEARIATRVTNQAVSFQQEIRHEFLALDQTLRILAAGWQADPQHFDLNVWRGRTAALFDLSSDMLLTDKNGTVTQDTAPGLIGTNVATADYFRGAMLQGRAAPETFLGGVTSNNSNHQWCMKAARRNQLPGGGFAGIVAVDWCSGAIDDLFQQADIGPQPLMALVGLTDGKLRAIDGPAAGVSDPAIGASAMFQALATGRSNTWVGNSALDGIRRCHAFRQIPGTGLAVVVGMDYADALAPALAWARQARLFAGCISVLIATLATLLLVGQAQARHRQAALARERTGLAVVNAQLEFARAQADAKTAQLQATLEGMHDGVAMMDANLHLVEWNERFPEIAGVPRDILRIGLPVEDILRAQARRGQFGPVDVEAEVARRIAALRSDVSFAPAQRRRPDGRVIELRRNRLADGGLVTLYSDVTERRQAEDALREARAIAENATAAKSRFVAIVSHEIRTPLNALLATLSLLNDGGLPPAQQALLDMARGSGDALVGLINDILDMSRMEAGQLALRPSVFGLRGVLEQALEIFRHQGRERGITLALVAAPDLPAELYADPGRLRQVLINLLSNAVKFGQPGVVGLMAAVERGEAEQSVLYLAVRDQGPVIEPDGRARLFQPFSQLGGDDELVTPLGSGLGLAICKQIVSLMGGDIGCAPWMAENAQGGNEFWLRVPIVPLPAAQRRPAAPEPQGRRILPRTRILLVEDVPANQLITTTLLRREGHAVDVASDGAQALAMVARCPYDLVFMDIFMPGMNGFVAARRVRGLPPPAGLVPIVALTASMTPDDQALCREAGMNRLLGKPIALPELVQAIADLAWRGMPARDTAQRASVPAYAGTPILSSERIGELRHSLPGDMLGGMVAECLVDLRARLPRLRQAMEAGDGAAVVSQAHAMLGMAAGYGMSALEARLRTLILAARETDIARAASLAAALDTELGMAADALREALAIEMV
jgi:signal transduction histidine kinase